MILKNCFVVVLMYKLVPIFLVLLSNNAFSAACCLYFDFYGFYKNIFEISQNMGEKIKQVTVQRNRKRKQSFKSTENSKVCE